MAGVYKTEAETLQEYSTALTHGPTLLVVDQRLDESARGGGGGGDRGLAAARLLKEVKEREIFFYKRSTSSSRFPWNRKEESSPLIEVVQNHSSIRIGKNVEKKRDLSQQRELNLLGIRTSAPRPWNFSTR